MAFQKKQTILTIHSIVLSNEQLEKFLILNFRHLLSGVCFLLVNFPPSEFCMPMFRNTLSAYEDGTECSEMSAYKVQGPRNYPEENIQLEKKVF
jgi:hypothetical protein